MADRAETKKKKNSSLRPSSALKDLVVMFAIIIFVLILSYNFNIFIILVRLFQKYPSSITYLDEIIIGLLALSICLAVFAWRRFFELKKETVERLRLQEELLKKAKTEAEIERIISKQLHTEIELRKHEGKATT